MHSFIEEDLAIAELPVPEENHEVGSVVENFQGPIVHRWAVQRRLPVVVSKQISLSNVHVYHRQEGDREQKRNGKSISEAHKY